MVVVFFYLFTYYGEVCMHHDRILCLSKIDPYLFSYPSYTYHDFGPSNHSPFLSNYLPTLSLIGRLGTPSFVQQELSLFIKRFCIIIFIWFRHHSNYDIDHLCICTHYIFYEEIQLCYHFSHVLVTLLILLPWILDRIICR